MTRLALRASAAHGTDLTSRRRLTTRWRGGTVVHDWNAVDDNAALDAYIDSLVAGVDDSEQDSPDNVMDEESTTVVETNVVDDVPNNNDEDDNSIIVKDDEERLQRIAVEELPLERELLPSRRRQPRPNAVFRFLLDQGRLGRILVMLMIWIAEFVRAFIPPLANAVSTILVAIFGSPRALEDERGVNEQYVAFVDSRRTLRGKDKKKAVRMADQEAAEQLRRVGSVTEARYKHLSQDFMQRHGLGPYTRDEEDEQSEATITDARERGERGGPVVDEDDDVDWIVAALTKDDSQPIARTGTFSSKPAIDVGVSTTGVTVGVSFSIGGTSTGATKKKKSKRRKKLIEAATSNVSEKRVKAGPRASDRDGGGGVLGRIRDFSANNLVSRSLLGAYPGDALTPAEAASAKGLCDFAMKYGYGDWSDEDDNRCT